METSVTCLDRKRKLQAEPLGLPPSKHACGSESFDLEYGKQGDTEAESGNDSNSNTADTDSSMLTSCDTETGESSQSKDNASKLQSVSSSQLCSNCSSLGLYTSADTDIGEHVQEFGCLVDGYCLECNASIKGLKELIYANEVVAETSVLASGEWTVVDADTERNTKKLTIDKEFENYFSALML